jgi:xanthine dehydrogenase YagS FAD-binding subunit
MRSFANVNPRDWKDAVGKLHQLNAVPAGGGSDLLGMIKEHLVEPDVLVHLKAVKGADVISWMANPREMFIGGLVTLEELSSFDPVRKNYTVLAEAAESVATPQIRNVGTLAGNICQRPWCWYYRNGFPCFKAGGKQCFSITGENQFHAIFGGGPSFIVHPSDTAPALLALDAQISIMGPSGTRQVSAAEFFALPSVDPARENVLAKDEVVAAVRLPNAKPNTRSTYHKVMDREAWTHAVVSAAIVLEMDQRVCKSARIVLGGVAPIPWRLPKVEALLAGQRITPELAAQAGELALEGANPLAKNRYKIPLTKAVVRRTLLGLAEKA